MNLIRRTVIVLLAIAVSGAQSGSIFNTGEQEICFFFSLLTKSRERCNRPVINLRYAFLCTIDTLLSSYHRTPTSRVK